MKDPEPFSSNAGRPLTIFAGLFEGIVEQLRRSTVEVMQHGRGGGAGVIWSADGRIVTNAHVVSAPQAKVRLADGRIFDARLTHRDEARDLAALTIPAVGLPAATLGDSGPPRAGELALAVGNPLGHVGALNIGVIHAADERWIRADVRLAPGNSGGPLANARGEVIGINSLIARGLAHAIPSLTVKRFMAGRSETDRVRLGVSYQPVEVGARGQARLGLLLIDVELGSAAERAGLGVGDILIGVDDREIQSPQDLAAAIERMSDGGGVLELEILRGGRLQRVAAEFQTMKDTLEAA